MKILGSFFRGPDRLACACVSNKPFVCLCLRVQSIFEVCCLSGDSEACPRAGDVLDAPPHHQVPETAPAPAPRRRTPATLPVRLSKSWSLTSNGADSIRWGRRPPEPRSLCPSCRLLPGLPRNPGSPRLRHAQPGTHHGVAPHVPPASDVAPGIRLENKRWSKPKTYQAKRHVSWVLSNEWLFFLISSWFSKLHLKTMKWHKEATE